MKHRKTSSGLSILGITAFFLGCFMLLVLFGTMSYRNIASVQRSNNERRALLTYLQTVSKMSSDKVYKDEDPQYGTILVAADGDTGYGNRIYLYEGSLVEDYGRLGGTLMPDAAIRIADTAAFRITEAADGLLRIDTDQGFVFIGCRKEENDHGE